MLVYLHAWKRLIVKESVAAVHTFHQLPTLHGAGWLHLFREAVFAGHVSDAYLYRYVTIYAFISMEILRTFKGYKGPMCGEGCPGIRAVRAFLSHPAVRQVSHVMALDPVILSGPLSRLCVEIAQLKVILTH